jgi:Na+-driven multidrug efflux pump
MLGSCKLGDVFIFKRSLVIIGCFSLAMTILSEVFAYLLSYAFVGYDAELLALTVSGFRIFSFSFLFMGYAIFASGLFTALNDGVTSAIISFLRTLVFQTAAVLILPLFFDIDGIWASVIVAEFMAMAISAIFVSVKSNRFSDK